MDCKVATDSRAASASCFISASCSLRSACRKLFVSPLLIKFSSVSSFRTCSFSSATACSRSALAFSKSASKLTIFASRSISLSYSCSRLSTDCFDPLRVPDNVLLLPSPSPPPPPPPAPAAPPAPRRGEASISGDTPLSRAYCWISSSFSRQRSSSLASLVSACATSFCNISIVRSSAFRLCCWCSSSSLEMSRSRLCRSSRSFASESFCAISRIFCCGVLVTPVAVISCINSWACCARNLNSSVSAWFLCNCWRTTRNLSSRSLFLAAISSTLAVSSLAFSTGSDAQALSLNFSAASRASMRRLCNESSSSCHCRESFSDSSSFSKSSFRSERRSCVAPCNKRWAFVRSQLLNSRRYCSFPTLFEVSLVAWSILTVSCKLRFSCCRLFTSCS
mmetsp:Transcript_116560/g.370719  ORF Transcript_116560/g.370719 Transcript_116560/m.370719 type:complete len:393 (+) Transcript_116560:7059-8237(+)